MPRRVAGDWQFPGLNPVQASALRRSLVFQAYQDVLAGIAAARAPSAAAWAGDAAETGAGCDRLDTHGAAPPAAAPCGDDGSWSAEHQAAEQSRSDCAVADGPGQQAKPLPLSAGTVSTEPVAASAMVAAIEGGAPMAQMRQGDDLSRIRRIDRALAARLAAAGVTSFAQIAAFSSGEVRRIARELELGKRIWRENWIEQAAILAARVGAGVADERRTELVSRDGGHTAEAKGGDGRRAETGRAVPVADEDEAPGPAACNGAPDAKLAAAIEDELDGEAQAPAVGPDKTGDVPVPVATDPEARPSEALRGDEAEAAGHSGVPDATAHTAVPARGMLDDDCDPQRAEVVPADVPASRGEACKVGRRAKRLPAPSLRRLTYIRGISEALADDLAAVGVRSIADIARWSAADVRWFRAVLGETARISADQWIEQAQILASGHWTRYALRLVSGEFASVVAAPQRPGPSAHPHRSRPTTVDGRPPERAIEAIDPGAGLARGEDRAPSFERGDASNAARRAPPPLPPLRMRTVIAAPVAIEPISFIMRGLGRSPRQPSAERQGAVPGGIETGAQTALTEAEGVVCDATAIGAAEVSAPLVVGQGAIDAGRPQEALVERAAGAPGSTDAMHDVPQAGLVRTADEPVDEPIDEAAAEPAPVSAEAAGDAMPQTFPATLAEDTFARLALAGAAEDVADAEVLVVRRKPAAVDKVPAATEALEAAIAGGGDEDDARDDEFLSFGEEAAVRIFARRRAPGEGVEAAAPTAMREVGRERPGYSPEFIARGRDVGDEEDGADGAAYAGYHDAVEEATVTIIRARASEEFVSSVLPDRPANDQPRAVAEPSAPPELSGPAPKKSSFGSRFLRALTGD